MSRAGLLAATALGITPPVIYGTVLTDEHVAFVGLLAGTVVTVAGLIAWIDYRIETKNKAQTRIVMGEIRHLRQMLAVKLDAPELALSLDHASGDE